MKSKTFNFSLVELLLVTTVLFVLASMLAPTLNRVFHNAQNAECKVHLKSVHQAIMLYVDDNDNYLPGPCEGRARPFYHNVIRYNSSGELARRNQKLGSFIKGYMETVAIDSDYSYNPALICPTSSELTELGDDPRYRTHYTMVNPTGIKRPFGIWKRRDSAGIVQPMEPSQRIEIVEDLSGTAMMKDNLDKNKTMSTVSDFPVHPEFLENFLYYDGSLESIQNLTF